MSKTATRTIEGFERRIWPTREIRIQNRDGDIVGVTGYAAPFNMLSEDLGGFRERIAPGFFAPALERGDNVKFLVNHDDLPLAAIGSGDLRLEEDEIGLAFDADWERSDPDVDRVVRKMKPGKLDKMSFTFNVTEDGDRVDRIDGGLVRTLLPGGCSELWDIAIVTFPAYRDTMIATRMLERVRRERQGPGATDLRRRGLDLTVAAARSRGTI